MALYLNDNRLIEELDFFRKLTLQGKTLGLPVAVFTPEDVDTGRKQVRALVYDDNEKKWKRQSMPLPTLIYDRCRYQKSPRFQLLRQFRTRYPDLTYLNRPIRHKWGVYELLSGNNEIAPHLPETVKYRTPADLSRMLKSYPLIILKPEDGTGGRGILSIRRRPEGLYLVRGRDRKRKIVPAQQLQERQIPIRFGSWNLKERYMVQQGIDITLPDGRVHDFRLLIQKNGEGEWEVTGCAGRIGAPRSVTSNLHGGGSAARADDLLRQRFSASKTAEIRQSMDRLSRAVAQQLEKSFRQLCELALDLAVDPRGHVWLLEVNPKPAREVFSRLGEQEVYRTAIRRPLEYALYLYRQTNKQP